MSAPGPVGVLLAAAVVVAIRLCWPVPLRRTRWPVAGVDRTRAHRDAGAGAPARHRPPVRGGRRWRGSVPDGRRAHRRRSRRTEEDLPAAVDLLRVAVTAGHTLHGAVGIVAATADGPVAVELGRVAAACSRGARMAEELARLPERLGPSARPLATTLGIAVVSGAPLSTSLQRLADAERRRARRRAEERIRRLPVLLLLPLVGFVLPAFLALTIVPVVLTAVAATSGAAP